MRSYDGMFHGFCSTHQCFQRNNLVCVNTKRNNLLEKISAADKSKIIVIFFLINILNSSFLPMKVTTCSLQHGLRTSHDVTQLSFWAYTFEIKLKFSFQILWTSEKVRYFCNMEKCPFSQLLLGETILVLVRGETMWVKLVMGLVNQ